MSTVQRSAICVFLCLLVVCRAMTRAGHVGTNPRYKHRHFSRTNIDHFHKPPGCDLVLTVFSRWSTLQDRLAHYQNLPEAFSILVIVNNPNLTLAHLPDPDFYAVPVTYKFMEINSMNNRFVPWPELTNDCIITVDDDFDLNLAELGRAAHVWRTRHRDRLVGFSLFARNHVYDGAEGKYAYCPKTRRPGGFMASIVLPGGGMVFHKKFLELYTFSTPQSARDLVDKTMNGDDILINFVAANHTGRCPIVLQGLNATTSGVISSLSDSGLSSRRTHYTDKSDIMNGFVSIFGRMPLSYTTRFTSTTRAQPDGESECFEIAPHDYKC